MRLDVGEHHFDWSHPKVVRTKVEYWYIKFLEDILHQRSSMVRCVVKHHYGVLPPLAVNLT